MGAFLRRLVHLFDSSSGMASFDSPPSKQLEIRLLWLRRLLGQIDRMLGKHKVLKLAIFGSDF